MVIAGGSCNVISISRMSSCDSSYLHSPVLLAITHYYYYYSYHHHHHHYYSYYYYYS